MDRLSNENRIMNALFAAVVFMMTTQLTAFAQANNQERVDSARIRFQENTHQVVLDDQSKIISWITPQSKSYDVFLHQRWDFIKHHVPLSPGPAPRSLYPQYYIIFIVPTDRKMEHSSPICG
jgi:hypothetical protein